MICWGTVMPLLWEISFPVFFSPLSSHHLLLLLSVFNFVRFVVQCSTLFLLQRKWVKSCSSLNRTTWVKSECTSGGGTSKSTSGCCAPPAHLKHYGCSYISTGWCIQMKFKLNCKFFRWKMIYHLLTGRMHPQRKESYSNVFKQCPLVDGLNYISKDEEIFGD